MGLWILDEILGKFKDALALLDRQQLKKDKLTEALVCLQTATIETQKFINEVGYVANSDLSKLWLNAFEKIKKSQVYSHEEDFPEGLYSKAKFWGDPKKWLKEPAAMELIPKLKQIEKECDSILVKLK